MIFEPIEDIVAHAEWAITLQPGDKVLTNWNDRIPEYTSQELVPPISIASKVWREVTIDTIRKDNWCDSGVIVTFKEYPVTDAIFPNGADNEFDSSWIKPREVTDENPQ